MTLSNRSHQDMTVRQILRWRNYRPSVMLLSLWLRKLRLAGIVANPANEIGRYHASRALSTSFAFGEPPYGSEPLALWVSPVFAAWWIHVPWARITLYQAMRGPSGEYLFDEIGNQKRQRWGVMVFETRNLYEWEMSPLAFHLPVEPDLAQAVSATFHESGITHLPMFPFDEKNTQAAKDPGTSVAFELRDPNDTGAQEQARHEERKRKKKGVESTIKGDKVASGRERRRQRKNRGI